MTDIDTAPDLYLSSPEEVGDRIRAAVYPGDVVEEARTLQAIEVGRNNLLLGLGLTPPEKTDIEKVRRAARSMRDVDQAVEEYERVRVAIGDMDDDALRVALDRLLGRVA